MAKDITLEEAADYAAKVLQMEPSARVRVVRVCVYEGLATDVARQLMKSSPVGRREVCGDVDLQIVQLPTEEL